MRTLQRTALRGPGWSGLVRIAGLADLGLLLLTVFVLRDMEALAYIGVTGAALWMAGRRKGVLGRVVLGVVFANVALWMTPGAVSNLLHGEDALATLLPSALAVVSLAGLAGVAGWLLNRGRPHIGGRGARVVQVAAGATLAAVAVITSVGRGGSEAGVSGEVVVRSRNVRFLPDEVRVEAGEVTIRMENGDLFWHTFTLPDLDVDLSVPVRGERRVTFDAPRGTYEFVCAIPGHTKVGMTGVLIIE
jgi:plastocyanin